MEESTGVFNSQYKEQIKISQLANGEICSWTLRLLMLKFTHRMLTAHAVVSQQVGKSTEMEQTICKMVSFTSRHYVC